MIAGRPARQSGSTKVQVIANGEGFSVAEGQAMVAQNARTYLSGQIVSGTVDSDGNILINL